MIVAGVFAWLGDVSVTLAGVGLIVLLVGAGTLLSTQSRSSVSNPHPAVYAILVIAIAVHAYHHLTSESSPGFFAWALVPYAVALTIACFRGARIAVAAGAALALALDVWTYYVVAHPTSSTAGLALLWMPLWNAIIVVPAD